MKRWEAKVELSHQRFDPNFIWLSWHALYLIPSLNLSTQAAITLHIPKTLRGERIDVPTKRPQPVFVDKQTFPIPKWPTHFITFPFSHLCPLQLFLSSLSCLSPLFSSHWYCRCVFIICCCWIFSLFPFSLNLLLLLYFVWLWISLDYLLLNFSFFSYSPFHLSFFFLFLFFVRICHKSISNICMVCPSLPHHFSLFHPLPPPFLASLLHHPTHMI